MAAKAGAKVLLVTRDEVALATAVRDIQAAGGTAEYAVADVGDQDEVQAAADKAMARFGRIDSWVNNAGVAIYAKLMETPGDEHEQLFRTNYFGMVHGCVVAVPLLAKQGGALITVASVASDMPSPIMGAYAASKHALKAYVEALRMELRLDQPTLSLTLIKPSGIDTPIAHHAANHEGGAARVPPPAYDPALVAQAILGAAVRPRREITVGGAGRAQVLFANHFPGLFERLAPVLAKGFTADGQRQRGPDNLFAPAQEGDERSGDTPALRSSVYTQAQLNPKTAALVVGGVAAGLAMLWQARARRA